MILLFSGSKRIGLCVKLIVGIEVVFIDEIELVEVLGRAVVATVISSTVEGITRGFCGDDVDGAGGLVDDGAGGGLMVRSE